METITNNDDCIVVPAEVSVVGSVADGVVDGCVGDEVTETLSVVVASAVDVVSTEVASAVDVVSTEVTVIVEVPSVTVVELAVEEDAVAVLLGVKVVSASSPFSH